MIIVENLGLLTDATGITGTEDLTAHIHNLSAQLKMRIFQDRNITVAAAQEFLANTPTVFGYLQLFVNTYVLHAILLSPIIQNAIAQHKVPLFFLTSNCQVDDIPASITQAIAAKKIRVILSPWLDGKDFRAVSTIFLNKDTCSIVIPSGDNSLTACFQAGKLPFYAHKWIKSEPERESFKCGIFQDLQQIMLAAKQQGLMPDAAGFTACYETFRNLSTRYTCDPTMEKMRRAGGFVYHAFYASCIKNRKTVFFSERGKFLTREALEYFNVHVAPYILKHHNFASKSLPHILQDLEQCALLANTPPSPAQYPVPALA
jgi:hypothetical protein